METYERKLQSCLRRNPAAYYYFLKLAGMWRPQAFAINIRWDAASNNQAPRRATFAEAVTDDMIVTAVVYNVYRPNYLPGSVQKPGSDQANALRPGISVRLNVEGGFESEQYPINIRAMRIENLLPQAQNENGSGVDLFDAGFVLSFNQKLEVEAFLNRTLESSEVPYELEVAVRGIRLGCREYNGLTTEKAKELIRRDFGIDYDEVASLGALPLLPKRLPAAGK